MQINIRYTNSKFKCYIQIFDLYSSNIKQILENSYKKKIKVLNNRKMLIHLLLIMYFLSLNCSYHLYFL